ncbi:MAG: spore germination protein [Clostridia bacterium]|nr:spore germination protein [Clostridia bacterium]
MERLTGDYRENVRALSALLAAGESFDLIERRVSVGDGELTLFYIDGFVKDGVLQRLLEFISGRARLPVGPDAAFAFASAGIPYPNVDVTGDVWRMVSAVLSGVTLLLGSGFGDRAILIDARAYPARQTDEPQSDRVMQGARDGFVETLIFNTALIRRRIRDPDLRIKPLNLGGRARTDCALCYIEGRADPAFLARLEKRLAALRPDSLTLGYESLAELLIPRRWFNPFPKIRSTERPDCAAAHLVEGSVILLCDTSPQAMILPTGIFDFLQESQDFYLPPLTGSYLRFVRFLTFLLSLVLTPLWYLFVTCPWLLPASLSFLIPTEAGHFPILLQLFLVEFAVDGLKLASMNTPDLLANSMSVVGGLVLGDLAVKVGWLSGEVIFYMAIVAVAGFTQQNHELGYAMKFLRLAVMTLTALFSWVGFLFGLALIPVLLVTNAAVDGRRSSLYPLIPVNGRALLSLFFRLPKAKMPTAKRPRDRER